MTRKARRLILILVALTLVGGAAALALYALRENIIFFYTPTEVISKAQPGQHLRVGGMVKEGSLMREADQKIRFVMSDETHTLPVIYQGALPDLFREGQGVVAEGILLPSGALQAQLILAKHDERYMPADISHQLKQQGHWKAE